MQRLTPALPYDDNTVAIYEELVAIVRRHLPPTIALLYATARRNTEGGLEWWTDRQGIAVPVSSLSESEQQQLQQKCQQYQDIINGLIEQLTQRGDTQSAQALQRLLNFSQSMQCYSVGGEPVLVELQIDKPMPTVQPAAVAPVVAAMATKPWWKRLWPWLLLLLLLLLLALLWWWFACRQRPVIPPAPAPAPIVEEKAPVKPETKPVEVPPPPAPLVPPEPPAPPIPVEKPKPVTPPPPKETQLTQANPSVSLDKKNDFGHIKVNLTWKQGSHQRPIDLDVAAFVRLKDGRKGGVEALSHFFGFYDKPPFIQLRADKRTGNSRDGEWIDVNGSQWKDIDEVLVYSFIYSGATSWKDTNATTTIYVPGQAPIRTTLTDATKFNNYVAAIARLKNVNGAIKVERLNRVFRDRESLDKYYGWGFEWTPGASKN